MKKMLMSGISKIFLLLLLSICLCACGGDNSSNTSQKDTSDNVTTSSTTTESTTDKIPSNITEDGNSGYGPYYRR